MVALLRGINVGGHRLVPMAELRKIAEDAGLTAVATYIQSGNVVFTTTHSTERVAKSLEAGILARFGFAAEVIVRTKAQWRRALSTCPFAAAAAERPHLLHLCLSRRKPDPAVVKALMSLCSANEKIALVGDALWIDYAAGVARSKLSASVLDRAVGSAVTARNWKTAQQLAVLLGRSTDNH
jgi:uncharacterized protein (DUF1697 family)